MRLWHIDLLPCLPKQWLQGQHRECCALRGLGWNKPHATVNYVFNHSPTFLVKYHLTVIDILVSMGVNVDTHWKNPNYRGKRCDPWPTLDMSETDVFPEHDRDYKTECVANLRNKGVIV